MNRLVQPEIREDAGRVVTLYFKGSDDRYSIGIGGGPAFNISRPRRVPSRRPGES